MLVSSSVSMRTGRRSSPLPGHPDRPRPFGVRWHAINVRFRKNRLFSCGTSIIPGGFPCRMMMSFGRPLNPFGRCDFMCDVLFAPTFHFLHSIFRFLVPHSAQDFLRAAGYLMNGFYARHFIRLP